MPDRNPINPETPEVVLPSFWGLEIQEAIRLAYSLWARISEIFPLGTDIEHIWLFETRVRSFLAWTLTPDEVLILTDELDWFDIYNGGVQFQLAMRVGFPLNEINIHNSAS